MFHVVLVLWQPNVMTLLLRSSVIFAFVHLPALPATPTVPTVVGLGRLLYVNSPVDLIALAKYMTSLAGMWPVEVVGGPTSKWGRLGWHNVSGELV